MEKELNIAAILRDKPGAKLWSPIVGVCALNHINSSSDINVTIGAGIYYNGSAIYSMTFNSRGKYGGEFKDNTIERECMLFPSKEMRDWSKFAWKKGDVLVSDNNKVFVVYNRFANEDYTMFKISYVGYKDGNIGSNDSFYNTADYHKVSKEDAKEFIKSIEVQFGGKLNLSTLEIEKPQFKDGDIVVTDYVEGVVFICICNKVEDNFMYCHARMNSHNKDLYLKKAFLKVNLVNRNPRYATDSEKQQLFDALAKENKTWDAEKKQIVDLPKKCEFKAFDKVLVRCKDYQKWKVDFFSHYDDSCKGFPYVCVSSRKSFCIPYTDQTAHLLGTTDDWEGGEE